MKRRYAVLRQAKNDKRVGITDIEYTVSSGERVILTKHVGVSSVMILNRIRL